MSELERDRHGAELYIHLAEIWQNPVQSEARAWFAGAQTPTTYKSLAAQWPPGSPERERLFNLLGFFEIAAVLVHAGSIGEDLFFDAPFGFEGIWGRLGSLLKEWRTASGDPAAWENVIWLGSRMDEWDRTRWRSKLPEDDLVRRRLGASS